MCSLAANEKFSYFSGPGPLFAANYLIYDVHKCSPIITQILLFPTKCPKEYLVTCRRQGGSTDPRTWSRLDTVGYPGVPGQLEETANLAERRFDDPRLA